MTSNILFDYLQKIHSTYGTKFLVFLTITQFIVKGLLYYGTIYVALPFYKHLGVDVVSIQLYGSIAFLPWTLKPLTGLVSDIFPIGSYNKRWWLILSITLGILAALALAIPVLGYIYLIVISFLLLNLEISVCDLYSEAKYSEIMRENPDSGSRIITFVSGCQKAGSLISFCVIGPLADRAVFEPLFIAAVCLSFAPLIPALLGWLPEKMLLTDPPRIIGTRFAMFNAELFENHRRVIGLSAYSGCAGLLLTFSSLFLNIYLTAPVVIVVIASVVGLSYYVLPRRIANFSAYIVLTYLLRPSLDSAIEYYYTADAICAPEGPHFSFQYFVTYIGIAGACVGLVGLTVYQSLFSTMHIQKVMSITSILYSLSSLVDLSMLLRIHSSIGLPDEWFYFFGSAIKNFTQLLMIIPIFVVISKMCVSGIESTMYAYLIGMYNLSIMSSGVLGAFVYKLAGITTMSGFCVFDGLWLLVLIFNILLPLAFIVPLALFLLPDANQTDTLIGELLPQRTPVELGDFCEEASQESGNP